MHGSLLFDKQLRGKGKGKALRKHNLHKENSSLGFIEAVHQW